ncbi:MAG: hypothetical protein JWN70_917 [Planctomycetaceae bacterium]|nr:hypothetical protein [Planctomycetaceae bacterium]
MFEQTTSGKKRHLGRYLLYAVLTFALYVGSVGPMFFLAGVGAFGSPVVFLSDLYTPLWMADRVLARQVRDLRPFQSYVVWSFNLGKSFSR